MSTAKTAEEKYELARRNMNDEAVKDKSDSFALLKEAASENYLPAIHALAYCYEKGIGTEIDAKKALDYYQDAAQKGYAPSQYNVGYCYEKGLLGLSVNLEKAFQQYKLAAIQKFPMAIIRCIICRQKLPQALKQDSQYDISKISISKDLLSREDTLDLPGKESIILGDYFRHLVLTNNKMTKEEFLQRKNSSALAVKLAEKYYMSAKNKNHPGAILKLAEFSTELGKEKEALDYYMEASNNYGEAAYQVGHFYDYHANTTGNPYPLSSESTAEVQLVYAREALYYYEKAKKLGYSLKDDILPHIKKKIDHLISQHFPNDPKRKPLLYASQKHNEEVIKRIVTQSEAEKMDFPNLSIAAMRDGHLSLVNLLENTTLNEKEKSEIMIAALVKDKDDLLELLDKNGIKLNDQLLSKYSPPKPFK